MPNNTDWTPDGPEEHGLNDASLKQLRTMYQEMKQQGLTGNDKDARHLEVRPLAKTVCQCTCNLQSYNAEPLHAGHHAAAGGGTRQEQAPCARRRRGDHT